MKLKKLLRDISSVQIKGSKEIEITGICANSKLIAPGNLFIARKGKSLDGSKYIPEAIAAGAVVILTDIYDPSLREVTQLIHPNVDYLEAILAAHYYSFPSEELFIVGITGTNGKTTSSFLVKHILDKLNGTCGIIGTVEYSVGGHRYQSKLTTPDVVTNHKMLREMVINGCQSAVMEITSHALDQGRERFINFDVAVFTNLTQDHLDYHKTMENYCEAKNKLFSSLHHPMDHANKKTYPKNAIINVDSPWYLKIIENCQVPIITYSIDRDSDLQAIDLRMSPKGSQFSLLYQGELKSCSIPLPGRFNVYNALAAIAVGLCRQLPLDDILQTIADFPSVPGRLELVPNPLDLKIYVDFAHSDDALKNVLKTLNEFKKDKIITVFGCGGDRDKGKRPKMAKVAEEFSDFIIVTSDNPRSENPKHIIQDIVEGFSPRAQYEIEIDREKAIEKAIERATVDDIILIAGKGHEAYQIFANQTIAFDDRKIAQEVCQRIGLIRV